MTIGRLIFQPIVDKIKESLYDYKKFCNKYGFKPDKRSSIIRYENYKNGRKTFIINIYDKLTKKEKLDNVKWLIDSSPNEMFTVENKMLHLLNERMVFKKGLMSFIVYGKRDVLSKNNYCKWKYCTINRMFDDKLFRQLNKLFKEIKESTE